MGFYIKDLYVHRVPKFSWHDRLTNPPTIPETSPIIRAAALSPHVVVAGQGGRTGGEVGLPADDTTLWTIPTPITPIVFPGSRLEETDLQLVRDNLRVTLEAVERQIDTMQASGEDLAYVASVVGKG
ncbi:MAG: hypothetical protein JWP82_3263 [Humibacillus sp.]|nr:hypothetical protein [Humibacillus sp.]